MDPEDALSTDRSIFESELDDLIDSAMNSEAPLHSLKRPAPQNTPNKRQKTYQDPSSGDDQHSSFQHLQVDTPWEVLLERAGTHSSSPVECKMSKKLEQGAFTIRKPELSPAKLQYIPTGPRFPHTSNIVRRQWDPSKDNLDYRTLLEQRRRQKRQNVDRYVPDYESRKYPSKHLTAGSPTSRRPPKVFPLDKLPKNVLQQIFRLLLVAPDPITIDFYWLRPFVNGHARVPSVNQSVEHEGITYSIPISWPRLLSDIDLMRTDMLQFAQALETRGMKGRRSRTPCRGLTPGLLRVSRGFHELAAPIFYGQNLFKFPCAESAWIQLDSFLATIGPKNIANIKRLLIHVPMWHRSVQEDFLEGALIDSLSPASRLAVIKPPPHDRLLSAVRHAVQVLLKSTKLTKLVFNLENGLGADYWCDRMTRDRKLISVADADEFVNRKREGTALLKQLSDLLGATGERPLFRIIEPSKDALHDEEDFQRRLVRVRPEAEKYGWRVDSHLKQWR